MSKESCKNTQKQPLRGEKGQFLPEYPGTPEDALEGILAMLSKWHGKRLRK